MQTARLTELQVNQEHALYCWGLRAPSSFIYRKKKNTADGIGGRNFLLIIDVTLNSLLLKQNKKDTVCNFRAFAFISNKFLPMEILLLRRAEKNLQVSLLMEAGVEGDYQVRGSHGVRPSKRE